MHFRNDFSPVFFLCIVIKDCKQYNTALGYNGALNYIPISSFTHVVDQREFKYYVFGVLGTNDAVIRLSHSVYPYGTEVVEVGKSSAGLSLT